EDCTLAMAEMIRAGDFRPLLSEVSFGEKGKWLGEYEIPVSKDRKIFLTGKIDRIDVAEMDGKKAVIIFDYKRKEKSFGWSQLYYGLDMQLAIYILAVRSAADAEMKNAIGAFYLPIEISPQKAALDELQKKKQDFNYKAKGIFNGEFFRQLDNSEKAGWNKFYNFQISSKGDQYSNYVRSGALKPDDFENVLRFTEKKIVELTQQMFKGKIDIKPYRLGGQSPCSYCEYKPLCRFDWQLNDYNYLIPVNGKNEVVKKTNV
ncbi:MAG: PD-(D/E)XK nuclease family protein, partial [Planctomycetes bacterium]|nr:PD-(D/E)XK nuclease family protein [Planctomycetota bacterium]